MDSIDQTYARSIGPCPVCGATRVERANGNTGDHFIGCSAWPRCEETMPIPAHEHMKRAGATSLPGFD